MKKYISVLDPMSHPKTAVFKFHILHPELVYKALSVETTRDIPRTKIKMHHDKNTLFLSIQAADTNALRAAVNSYLRWIELSIKIVEL